MPIEAMKFSVNRIADVSHQYEHHARMLWALNKYIAKHVSGIRRAKKSETIDGTHVRVAAIPSENGDFVRWRLGSIKVH